MSHRLGFVGTRFAGSDGVSLESAKWAHVLEQHGHQIFWMAGEVDPELGSSMLVPEAHFTHPEIRRINEQAFRNITRSPELSREIHQLSNRLKDSLYEFVRRFKVEVLIVENALSLPMNIPLGVALNNFIAETGMPTIAHHHDFYWERRRFLVNSVADILWMAFPPALPFIQHVTINSFAQQALSSRHGASTLLIHNVLDFENPPTDCRSHATRFRNAIGLQPDDIMFLQPTRVIPRKGIEHSISLLSRLRNPKCKLVISHPAGDEGDEYQAALIDKAEHDSVDLRFAHTKVGNNRGMSSDGEETFTLEDAYAASDFVTYPSLYEGFGNALLEAFYFHKPVMVNRYASYVSDIEPRGFKAVTMDGYLTREVVAEVQRVLSDDNYRTEMVEHNYELGRAFFSYEVLRRTLGALITNLVGVELPRVPGGKGSGHGFNRHA
jgi:glycosyltransferase involved in cell wall biosynthesis